MCRHLIVLITFLYLHTPHFIGSFTGATLLNLRNLSGGGVLFMFFSSPFFNKQKQAEGLGRSDTDREIIQQCGKKELLISCSDRSDNLSCEYRLTEVKQGHWHRDRLHSETVLGETSFLFLSVFYQLPLVSVVSLSIRTQWQTLASLLMEL